MSILQFFKITIIVHSFFFCMLSISESNNNTSSPYDHEMLAQKLNGQNNNGIPKSSRRKKRQQLFGNILFWCPLTWFSLPNSGHYYHINHIEHHLQKEDLHHRTSQKKRQRRCQYRTKQMPPRT